MGLSLIHHLTCSVVCIRVTTWIFMFPPRGKRHCRSGWERWSLPAGRWPQCVPGLWGWERRSSWGGEESCERDGPEGVSTEVSGPRRSYSHGGPCGDGAVDPGGPSCAWFSSSGISSDHQLKSIDTPSTHRHNHENTTPRSFHQALLNVCIIYDCVEDGIEHMRE